MPLQFGTDGLRGVANKELTAELALALGKVAAHALAARSFVVGSDTRQSSPMLKAALSAGIASRGVDVIDVGVLPTPGVAWIAAKRSSPGAIVSASHNPYLDNGIKLVSSSGTKIADDQERAIEVELETALAGRTPDAHSGDAVVGHIDQASYQPLVDDYVAHLLSSVSLPSGAKLKIVCDCSNGAASLLAKKVFEGFGVETLVICDEPDGTNINDHCGSTHPARVAKAVVESGADLGLSFDGDADRLVACAHDGTIIDGDRLLAMFALDLLARGELEHSGIVVTVMSNLGLRQRLEQAGITVIETPVGDRYVADALAEADLVLGGEQSGHIIFRQNATTGDGMLSGLKLVELVARAGRSLGELAASAMVRLPQELRTLYVANSARLDESHLIWSQVQAIHDELGESGRVLLRRSGTEPAVRVMVEAPTHERAIAIVEQLSALIERELGENAAQLR